MTKEEYDRLREGDIVKVDRAWSDHEATDVWWNPEMAKVIGGCFEITYLYRETESAALACNWNFKRQVLSLPEDNTSI